MGLQIAITDREALRMLEGMVARVRNLKPAMKTVGEAIRSSVERNFATQGRPTSWSDSIRAAIQGGETLSDSGRLRRSFTVRATDNGVSVGTNVKYASTHQFGAKRGEFGTVTAQIKEHVRILAGKKVKVKAHTRQMKLPWGDIPARPFLMVQDEDWDEIRAALNDYILGGK